MKINKTYILVFLMTLTLVLLAGCQQKNPGAAETTAPAPSFTLLEQAEAAGTSENLLYIPNPYVESMACPEIRLFGNGLLLFEQTMMGQLQMKWISLENGELLAEASYDLSPAAKVQVGNGLVGVSDQGTGQVLILNEDLETETTYTLPQEGDSWYLNQELDRLYVFSAEKGVFYRDLASGEIRWLLEDGVFFHVMGENSRYVLFSYTNRVDQKNYYRCLDLSNAVLETVPVDGAFYSGSRSGEQWLMYRGVTTGTYVLVDGETEGVFAQPEGFAQLLSGRRLLTTDDTYRNLYLYDLNGTSVSACVLPQVEYASVGTDFVWNGYWEGYFFRDTYDGAAHLMFWNPKANAAGENLPISEQTDAQPTEPVLEQALYQQAAALSERFGVDIRIAEQCALDYPSYAGEALMDPIFIRESLATLERTLSGYPEDFFRQLPYGDIQNIRFEVATNLQVKEDTYDRPPLANGFALTMDGYYLIVLNGLGLDDATVYHELSHVIDKRLEWDAMLRPEALFSEEGWLALQPEGFRYAESYTNIPKEILDFELSGYFVRRYAMTFPTEDRATLMALVLENPAVLKDNPELKKKMQYYAACIQDCFGCSDWPVPASD